jgi:enamine deaminase RidA (YjgF/YER057c/UK114 family)
MRRHWFLLFALLIALPAQARDPADLIQRPERRSSYERLHYADGFKAGGLVLFSGVVGVSRDQSNEPKAQFERAFENVGKVLAQAGLTWDDVLEMTTYVVELKKNFSDLAEIHANYVREPYPAWTAIGVVELLAPNALIEIRVIAKQK